MSHRGHKTNHSCHLKSHELPDWNIRRLLRSGQETLAERLESYFKE